MDEDGRTLIVAVLRRGRLPLPPAGRGHGRDDGPSRTRRSATRRTRRAIDWWCTARAAGCRVRCCRSTSRWRSGRAPAPRSAGQAVIARDGQGRAAVIHEIGADGHVLRVVGADGHRPAGVGCRTRRPQARGRVPAWSGGAGEHAATGCCLGPDGRLPIDGSRPAHPPPRPGRPDRPVRGGPSDDRRCAVAASSRRAAIFLTGVDRARAIAGPAAAHSPDPSLSRRPVRPGSAAADSAGDPAPSHLPRSRPRSALRRTTAMPARLTSGDLRLRRRGIQPDRLWHGDLRRERDRLLHTDRSRPGSRCGSASTAARSTGAPCAGARCSRVATNGCYDAETIALDEFGHVEILNHHVNFADESDYTDAVVQTFSRTRPKTGWNMHVYGVCDTATLQIRYDVPTLSSPYSPCLDLDDDPDPEHQRHARSHSARSSIHRLLKVDDEYRVRPVEREPDRQADGPSPAAGDRFDDLDEPRARCRPPRPPAPTSRACGCMRPPISARSSLRRPMRASAATRARPSG